MLLDGGCLNYRRPERSSRSMSLGNAAWTLSRPAVIYVQPRERHANKNHVLPAHNSVNISPDFSQFGGSSEKISYKESPRTSVSSSPPSPPLPPRTPKYVDYEEVLKQIEEDRPQELEIIKSQEYISQSAASNESVNVEEFIDIPLQPIEDKSDENKNAGDDSKILSRFFDQLLVDIYPHVCKQGSCKYCDNINRRRSESRLYHITKKHKEPLVRHHSYCLGLEGAAHYYHNNKVVEVEGFKRSYPFVLQRICASTPIVDTYKKNDLDNKGLKELNKIVYTLKRSVDHVANDLKTELDTKETYLCEQDDLCNNVTLILKTMAPKRSEDAQVKFSLSPVTQDQSGFAEWARAMRMVARLPDGVPAHFRKNLWLSLAERHLNNKGVTNWTQTERRLFSEYTNLEDRELSVQIVKDLHRTGCSLFCGVTGKHNQAVLKRVLLAYARWNKSVGYCQGLNMLAALILQVMQGSQSATVKVMIYLIEGVLPESYFANNLRGLSVDMAVFRDLLKLKLPDLSRHLDHLQQDSKESGTSYEPPLCDVFTMQWFLTIFSNCLPQGTVLRVWDLMFLEGDQILLRTALAIWQNLSERMMSVRSADEFYSIMAVLTREMLEFGLMESNNLIKAIDNMNIPEVADLREKYVYNISPWTVSTVARRGLKLFYPDPYEQDQGTSYESSDSVNEPRMTPFSNHPDREKIALDITALKRQYCKLRERQRQAHIILSACRGESLGSTSSPALNHLLLGKRALLSVKGRRIEGTVPPEVAQQKSAAQTRTGQTLHWRDAEKKWKWSDRSSRPSRSPSPYSSSTSSSSTELCDDSSDSEEASASPLPREDREGIGLDSHPESDSHVSKVVKETNTERVNSPEPASPQPSSEGLIPESPSEESLTTEIPRISPLSSSPLPSLSKSTVSPSKSHTRRDSEIALLQILQENSQILQRIQSHSFSSSATTTAVTVATVSQASFEEPDDIKEIRRKYEKISAQNSQETR
ncbi:TBC1 domain family member 30-like isoform X2 [Rhodnius prolixus]|uniref:Rab-GAP TBC domain-containing protein n=2 Tax=Rhodnius prolixus TaxID=13249 RepID=A0ABL0EJU7_RHOPR